MYLDKCPTFDFKKSYWSYIYSSFVEASTKEGSN